MKKPILIILAVFGVIAIIVGMLILAPKKENLTEPLSVSNDLPENNEELTSQLDSLGQNFFKGLTTDDFQMASKDFVPDFANEMTAQRFSEVKKTIQERIGTLTHTATPKLTTDNNLFTLDYLASFELEDNVMIRLVFQQENGDYKIAGIWFDSPKLR